MKRLVNYFIKYSISGNLLMVLILVFGIVGMMNMRSTFFPQAPIRNITIQAVYPGASAEEIEEAVVLKIEDQLTGVTGVERITSTSSENTASLNVEIKQRADVEEVLQDVKNAVDQINSFPKGLESVDVFKKENVNKAVSFSITGSQDLKELKVVARKIERDLLGKDGISKIAITGFPDEEISVEFREESLRSYGITMQQVLDKIAASNIEITGGTIKGPEEEFKIRLKNKAYFGSELQNLTVVSGIDGRAVKLKEVADIKDKWAEAPDRNFLNGDPTVTIDIQYTNDEDLLGIVAEVKAYVKTFNKENESLNITVINDQSKVVRQRIDMLANNGTIGFFIVLFLLAMFLHYRLAFWVALSIPIAFGGMFILASFFGITLNVISLFGMITVIGILVDDGVVISENIYQHHEMGKNRIRAAIDGTIEVMPAVFSAILTTIIVFSTFFFVEGRLGDFFSEMAFIVIATLIFSLVEGLLILPAHVAHSKALDKDAKPNLIMRSLTSFMDWMKNQLYKPVLTFSLKHPALAFAIPIGIFIITIGAMQGGIIGNTFFPPIERDNVTVNLKMPAGTRDHITESHLNYIEKAIWEVNEHFKSKRSDGKDIVISTDKRIGPVNGNQGSIAFELLASEDRNLKQADIISKLRETVGDIPGAEEFSFGSGNPFGKPVSIALRGDDMNELRMVTTALKAELSKLSDLKDITDGDVEGTKEIVIKLKEKAYLLGLTEQQVMGQIRQGFFGGEVQRIQRGLDEVKVWVRYEEEARTTIKQLKDVEIKTNTGGRYILADLVDFSIQRGVVSINHTDSKREITIEADVTSGVSASDMTSNIEENILPKVLADHPDIEFSFEGQSREQAKSTGSMKKVMPIILILMISVIIITFRSVPQTLAVVLLIPFGFIGVAWGHYLHGFQISLFSILGTIALIGILINDSLVFVSAFNINIKRGMPFKEALMEAALSRFRPIVLTSITTIAGLAPLIFEKSFQAQFLIPMALAIAYGLAVATVIILIILPVLLLATNRFRRFAHWWWYDVKLEPELVEPAYKELKFEDHE
jgi:multidrug efflux pump subunit AcrB